MECQCFSCRVGRGELPVPTEPVMKHEGMDW